MGQQLCAPDKDEARAAVEGGSPVKAYPSGGGYAAKHPLGPAKNLNSACPRGTGCHDLASAATQAIAGPPRPEAPKAVATLLPGEDGGPSDDNMFLGGAPRKTLHGSPSPSGKRNMYIPVNTSSNQPTFAEAFDGGLNGTIFGIQRRSLFQIIAICISLCVIGCLMLLEHTSLGGTSYDCDLGFEDFEDNWSPPKQKYCCDSVGRACPRSKTTTPALPFDCKHGRHDWKDLWSAGKQAWCCDHFEVGCEETTTRVPFDCSAGVDLWEKEWSVSKKAWCCEHEYVACPTASPGAPQPTAPPSKPDEQAYDCEEGFAQWWSQWDAHKRAWCCEFKNRGCPTMPPSTV